MESISFFVPGTPVGKGRPRVTKWGTYTPKKTTAYEKLVLESWRKQSGKSFPAGKALRAEIVALFPVPKSCSKKRAAIMDGQYHLKRPDCDNVAKAILDSLNGFAYPDDSAVQLKIEKRYTTNAPGATVTIVEAL